MLSWDMDADMAVYDEGNTDHGEGNDSALFQFYSFTCKFRIRIPNECKNLQRVKLAKKY